MSKNWRFSKGVNRWFCSKYGHFSNLFCKAILVRKMTFPMIQNEKAPFQAIQTKSFKSRKIDNFPKGVNPWFWSKYGHFFNPFFSGILVRKMTFTIIQNERAPLQAIKTRSSKMRKIDIFPKGLTHGFAPNMAIFPLLFFLALQVRKMTSTIFQNEKAPL